MRAAQTLPRTSYNTHFAGQKVCLNIRPQFVGRQLLADLSASAHWFRCKFGWNPRFEREKRLLHATFQAKHALHCPSKAIAATRADRLGVFEISCGKSSCPSNELKSRVSASLPFKVAGLVAAKLPRSTENVLQLLSTYDAAARFLHFNQGPVRLVNLEKSIHWLIEF